jgi:hypothetical protein
MDYREATQIQGQAPSAASVTEKLPMEALGRYMRAVETLRLGAARASREMLRAMLEVVDQDLAEAEAKHHGTVPAPRHGSAHAHTPGKRGAASPTERFRGVPPIRESSAPAEGQERGVEK